MQRNMFGLFSGHVSAAKAARIEKIAERHGVRFVSYFGPGCGCGCGCRSHCPALERGWFTTANKGEPFNAATAAAVRSGLREEGITLP